MWRAPPRVGQARYCFTFKSAFSYDDSSPLADLLVTRSVVIVTEPEAIGLGTIIAANGGCVNELPLP